MAFDVPAPAAMKRMRIRAYVLHLERARGRLPLVSELVETLPVPTTVIPAIDGRRFSVVDRCRDYRPRLHSPYYPFALRDAEIACFLSHRKAWESILEDDCDAGLVVEDDVRITSHAFAAMLHATVCSIRPGEYVRFPLRARGESGSVARTSASMHILEPRLPGLGMQMQLVERQAARMLLEASDVFDRPVDSFLQMQWIHGARVLSARPIVIQELGDEHGGSTVQQKSTDIMGKLSREVRRPLLRLSIRLANDRWRRRAAA